MSVSVFATSTEPLKNIEFVQLNLLENGNGILGVYYGYPIHDNAPPIEKTELYTGDISLITSELTVHSKRYAIVCCSVEYTNTTDLLSKIDGILSIEAEEYRNVLFNFYVLLDSVAENLNFLAIDTGVVTLTIDTSSFVNQKYYMTQLDEAIVAALPNVDTKTMRDVDTSFYLITANNIEVSNSEQFATRELNEVYTEYSCPLNNQKLSLVLSQKQPVVDEPVEQSKLAQFLNSKYYTWFIVGSCTFIVLAIIAMIIVAKSYTHVIEKEEKRVFEERMMRDRNDPQLYWSKEEREAEQKKKHMMKNPNALVRDTDAQDKVESIETSQYKRQSSFINK
jgi:hypothetical protein